MEATPSMSQLIHDWNREQPDIDKPSRPVCLDDETLRDGLQSPSVRDPEIEEKLELLHLMAEVGIDSANLGLPGAGPRAKEDVRRLIREIRDQKLPISPNCAARTLQVDIEPIVEISSTAGTPIEASLFIGSSPIRLFAEGWTLDDLLRHSRAAIDFAVKNGLPVMYVTEDTTRAAPEVVERLYRNAVECGARRVCIADTVGHATPAGTRALVRFVRNVVDQTGEEVKVDWHGHQDRGLGLINSLTALAAGADRVHGCALGVVERVGNTPMDLLLINLKLLGWIDHDLSKLKNYVATASRICDWPVPKNYPVFGLDAFRTATGVHAAAIIKAQNKGDAWLADRVYSGVPAGMVGLCQAIEIGNMSGLSNVLYWLEQRGVEPDKDLAREILRHAKKGSRVLSDKEIWEVIGSHRDDIKAGT